MLFSILKKWNISSFRTLMDSIISHDIIHIVFGKRSSLFIHIIPLIILSRFFSKKIILDCQTPEKYYMFNRSNFMFFKVIKYVDTVIAVSEYHKQLLYVRGIKSYVISKSIEIAEIKSQIIKSVQPRILISGSTERHNNILAVVKAYKIVKQKYPRSELVVAGGNEIKNSLEGFINQNNISGISFNETSAGNDLFEDADIFVNSVRFDYISSLGLRAMASGLPVISSPLSGEESFENRKNILYFRFNDHSSLADKLIELVENSELVKSLSSNGKLTASKFDISKTMLSWRKLYSSL